MIPLFVVLCFTFAGRSNTFALRGMERVDLCGGTFNVSVLCTTVTAIVALVLTCPVTCFVAGIGVSSRGVLVVIIVVPV